MSFKINNSHWNVIIEFMTKHPQFARGQFVGPAGKTTQGKLWEQLATQLNALGYGTKSVEKWQKTWTDIKYVIKRKAAASKNDLNQTGGGPASGKKLNEYEERILALLGKTFAEGVGSSECGLRGGPHYSQSQTSNRGPIDYSQLSFPVNTEEEVGNVQQEFMYEDIGRETVINTAPRNIQQMLSLPLGSSTIVNTPCSLTATPNPQDHMYTQKMKRPSKIPTLQDTENALYKEIIDELKSIKEGVWKISNNLTEINVTLREMKDVLLLKP